MTTALEMMDLITAAHWSVREWITIDATRAINADTARAMRLQCAIHAEQDAYDDWRVAGCPRRGPVFERLLSARTTLSLRRGM